MSGEFLSGLASGIFEGLGRQRQEQQQRDAESKAQTIQLLAGLADKIEPESMPTLLQHLGSVMGVKGKLKGFWNSFSGMADRSIEDQYGTKLKEITTGMVGPTAARNVRVGGDMARLFQPTTPEQQANQARRLQDERDLSNKLVFRDPRREKLEEIERRYSTQNELNLHKLALTQDFQRRQQEDRQTHEKEMIEERANAKAQGDVLKRAYSKAAQRGFREPTTALMAEASDEIALEQGLNRDLLRARIGLTEARTGLVGEQTNVAQVKAQRPVRPSRPTSTVSGGMRDRAMSKAVELFETTKQALIDATRRGDQAMMTSLRKRLQGMATNLASKYGDVLEIGGGDWPYQRPRDQQPQAPAQAGQSADDVITLQELQEVAKRKGISLEQAKGMARAEGLTVKE